MARLLNATTCLKHQAALSVAYGAGLRVAEVSMLKIADVDSERMLLRVERGKGGRYRNAMLSEDLLTLLRQWWKVGRQQGVMHRDGIRGYWFERDVSFDASVLKAGDNQIRLETHPRSWVDAVLYDYIRLEVAE